MADRLSASRNAPAFRATMMAMIAAASDRGRRSRRRAAMLIASCVPGPIWTWHVLASGGRFLPAYVVFLTASTLAELLVLTATLDLAMSRRLGNARSFLITGAVAI